MKRVFLLTSLILAPLAVHGQTYYVDASNCNQKNYSPPPNNPQLGNGNDHASGGHGYTSNIVSKCAYSGVASAYSQEPCTATATSTPQVWPWETGLTWYSHHELGKLAVGGQTGPAGGTAQSDAETASAVWGTVATSGTPIQISILGSGQGAGFSVGFSGGNPVLEEDKGHDGIKCTGYILNQTANTNCSTPNPPYPPSGGTCGGTGWQWSQSQCSWICPSGATPLAVDTKGSDWKGELFSDPKKGDYVSYDLGDGVVRKLSWPLPSSGVAWLVWVDGDGIEHVFGNYSPHANGDYLPSFNPAAPFDANGFTALQYYNQWVDASGNPSPQGGTGTVIMDPDNKFWSSLRLWFPKNCFENKDVPCHALPGELATLESEGIHSISLAFQGIGLPDKNGDFTLYDHVGNQLRLWAYLNPDAAGVVTKGHPQCCDLHRKSTKDGRKIVDVYLQQADPTTAPAVRTQPIK